MISFADALARVLADSAPLEVELVPLAEALGRILRVDVAAEWDLPPFANSAMDGYAVLAADTAAASAGEPARLSVVRRILAGRCEPGVAALLPGQAARIMTGGELPPGADAVVRQESVVIDGADILVSAPVAAGDCIRRAGEDAVSGRPLLFAGDPITPAGVGLLATLGRVDVPVGRRPRVGVLSTGDELVPLTEAAPGRIVDSNGHVLCAQARDAGAVPVPLGIAADRVEVLAERIRQGLAAADLIVTAGGSSVGEHDLVRAALEELNAEVRFWNVAMKPGKPLGYGTVLGRRFFALPGNPAAATTTFELLVRPALMAMQGARAPLRPRLLARLAAPARKQESFTYFLHGHAAVAGGGAEVTLSERQGAGLLTSALGTNALAVLPPGVAELPAGTQVDVVLTAALHAAPAPPIVGVIGFSGAGKTTLIERLIARLADRGLRVGALKHDAHRFQMDHEGKDTWRFRRAGARAVAIASQEERAMIAATDRPTPLSELASSLPSGLDLILVEGYKAEDVPKIEVHWRGRPLACRTVSGVVALVTDDEAAAAELGLPRFGHDDVDGVLALVLELASQVDAAAGR